MHWYLDVLKKYATFNGRASRSEYWMFTLINTVIMLVPYIIAMSLAQSSMETAGMIMIVVGIYSLAVLLPSIAVAVRRLHDTDRSGWWVLIGLVPLVGLVLIIFLVMKGTDGDNRFGPSPI